MNPSVKHDRPSRELDAARRIGEALFQHLGVNELVEQALRIALEVVDGQEGSVLLANPETETLVFYHSVGAHAPKPGTCFPWTQGIAGTVFSQGEPLVVQDAKQDERHMGKIDEVTGFTTHDMIALPLKRWEGHPIGVLEVINKKNGRLNEDDVAILTIIGAFTALAIEQAHLFQEAKLAEVARILGDIGQDINNLLMPVRGSASILKDEFTGALDNAALDPQTTRANYILCQKMIGLMDHHLNLVQERIRETTHCIKGLTTPLHFSTCFIQHVVGSVYDTLRSIATEKNITLLHEHIQDLPEIQADESRLFQAFYNVVKNAIEEMSQGGRILIRGNLDPSKEILSIQIQDSGPGFPPEIWESIFVNPSMIPGSKKSGGRLGLRIIRDVIEAHRGTITMESEPGQGSTFTLTLPIDPTH